MTSGSTSSPTAGDAAIDSVPVGSFAARSATARVDSSSTSSSLHLASSATPSSVNVKRRVERVTTLPPSARSSAVRRRLTVERGECIASAPRRTPPSFATMANISMSSGDSRFSARRRSPRAATPRSRGMLEGRAVMTPLSQPRDTRVKARVAAARPRRPRTSARQRYAAPMSGNDPTRTLRPRSHPRAEPPRDFGERFTVVRQLGLGAMGVVYEVIDRELEEHVALKVIYGDDLPADAVARLKSEVRLARRITHRNVVRIYDVGQTGPSHFFTMELVGGGTLKHRLTAGPLPHDEAKDIALQIANGLEAAHAAQVMHRDLKPSNVLLSPDGRAVLSDFGLARVLGAMLPDEVSGTPEYMAPEQRLGQDVDPRVDIYAFGAIVHELTDSPRLRAIAAECCRPAPAERPTAAALVRALQSLEGPLQPPPPERSSELPHVAQTLAVLPPRRMGELSADLAHSFGAEMVDALVRSRGLRVLGPSLTQAFEADRDPRRISAALGASSVVDTTLRLEKGQLRVGARLLDGATGRQLFSEHFEDELGCGLQLLETLSTRVAESLRIGIDAVANRGSAAPEVLELYLLGRAALERERVFGPDGATELLEAALVKAPDFGPALAAAAMAHIRAWFIGSGAPGALERARSAVERSDGVRRCCPRRSSRAGSSTGWWASTRWPPRATCARSPAPRRWRWPTSGWPSSSWSRAEPARGCSGPAMPSSSTRRSPSPT